MLTTEVPRVRPSALRRRRHDPYRRIRGRVLVRIVTAAALTALFAAALLSEPGAWLLNVMVAAASGVAVALMMATFAPTPVRTQEDAYAHARCMYCERSTLRRYRNLDSLRSRWAERQRQPPARLNWGDDRQCPHHRSFHRYMIAGALLVTALSLSVAALVGR